MCYRASTGGRFAASGGLFAGGPIAGGPIAGGPFAGGLNAALEKNVPLPFYKRFRLVIEGI